MGDCTDRLAIREGINEIADARLLPLEAVTEQRSSMQRTPSLGFKDSRSNNRVPSAAYDPCDEPGSQNGFG
jgi:hypothetical protein